MADTIRVTITAESRVRYSRTFDMPKLVYDAYIEAVNDDEMSGRDWDRFRERFGETWLDASRDWIDDDGFQEVEVDVEGESE